MKHTRPSPFFSTLPFPCQHKPQNKKWGRPGNKAVQLLLLHPQHHSLFSSICRSWHSGICRELTCRLTTSAHLSNDSMIFQGCERSTTIITVVCSIVSRVRTNGRSWLCQTTPSRIHTPMRSIKSAGQCVWVWLEGSACECGKWNALPPC